MTVTYEVFLPPKLAPLQEAGPSHLPVTFRNVGRPVGFESLSQSVGRKWANHGRRSLEQSLVRDDDQKIGNLENGLQGVNGDEEDGGWSNDQAKRVVAERTAVIDAGFDHKRASKRIRTRRQATERRESLDQPDDESIPSVRLGVQSLGKRRSGRLSQLPPRPLEVVNANAPVPTLPGTWHQDDSILSLNTTASDLSSLPPTNPGNTSVSNLPRWSIPLSKLVNLSSLISGDSESYDDPSSVETRRWRTRVQTQSGVCVIVCVTAVTSPSLVKTREDRSRGRDGTLWRSSWDVVSPTRFQRADGGRGAEEVGCEVVLWDKSAEQFGNAVRTGDIVLLQNAEFKNASTRGHSKPQLVLSSSSLRSPSATVLYRTRPRYDHSAYVPRRPHDKGTEKTKMLLEDHILRPDLRLGRSDPSIRRVAEYAHWFAPWIGGVRPPA